MLETVKKTEEWAEARNLIAGSNPKAQLLKLVEEVGELTTEINKDRIENAMSELGDVVVVATILAKQIGSTLPECLEIAYNKIKDRKGRMVDGVFVKEGD